MLCLFPNISLNVLWICCAEPSVIYTSPYSILIGGELTFSVVLRGVFLIVCARRFFGLRYSSLHLEMNPSIASQLCC